MVNIERDLKQPMYQKIDIVRGLAAAAESEGRGLTENEKVRKDKLMNEIRGLEAEIKAEETRQNEQAKEAKSIDNDPFYSPGASQEPAIRTGDDKSYRSLFYNNEKRQLDRGGFESFGEYLQVINSGRYDPRLMNLQKRQHEAGTGEVGGFAVPEEFAAFLLDKALEQEVVRPRARVYDLKHGKISIPKWANNDHSGGELFGGMEGRWVGELAENTDQEAALEQITLESNKLAIYAGISNELQHDSPSFEQELVTALRQSVSYFMDEAFLVGNAVAKPQGLLDHNSVITVERTTANEVKLADVIAMFSKLYKHSGGRPVWVVNHAALPELMTMQDEGNNLVWQPSAREGVAGQLFGYPVVMSEKNPTLGDTGDIMLADFSQYAIALSRDIYLDKNNAPGWYKDYTSYRCIVRVDGSPTWSQAFTTRNGGSLSWAVTLGEKL